MFRFVTNCDTEFMVCECILAENKMIEKNKTKYSKRKHIDSIERSDSRAQHPRTMCVMHGAAAIDCCRRDGRIVHAGRRIFFASARHATHLWTHKCVFHANFIVCAYFIDINMKSDVWIRWIWISSGHIRRDAKREVGAFSPCVCAFAREFACVPKPNARSIHSCIRSNAMPRFLVNFLHLTCDDMTQPATDSLNTNKKYQFSRWCRLSRVADEIDYKVDQPLLQSGHRPVLFNYSRHRRWSISTDAHTQSHGLQFGFHFWNRRLRFAAISRVPTTAINGVRCTQIETQKI